MNEDPEYDDDTTPQPPAKPPESAHNEENGSFPFKEYSFLALLAIGIVILGVYLMYLVNSIYMLPKEMTTTVFSMVVFNQGFVYAVIGAAVVLIALHLRNSTLSNKAIVPVAIFCGLNAAFLLIGVLIIISTLRLRFDQSVNLVFALLQVLAFVGFILVELPGVRRKLTLKFKQEEADEWEEDVQVD